MMLGSKDHDQRIYCVKYSQKFLAMRNLRMKGTILRLKDSFHKLFNNSTILV